MFELVAPTVCLACGVHADGDLCARCAEGVQVLDAPLQTAGSVRVVSLVAFAEPARSLTLHLKRRGAMATARVIGRLLASLSVREGLGGDVVAYAPGLGAELIARAVGSVLELPVRNLVRRTSDGPRQSEVPLERRRENVKGRFSARAVRGRVLLIDDVFTTGATAEACATALLEAGASNVDVLTWARTLRRRPILGR